MLEHPHYGWSRWELPYFSSRISFIDDFPFMVLEALIDYFKTGDSRDVTFDAEGWEYTFTFAEDVRADGSVICESTVKFSQEFIRELENDLDVWAHFARDDDSAKDELVGLIGELRRHLPNGKSAFVNFLESKFEKIQNPDIDDDIRNRYFKEFEELNRTTSSIYDLGGLEVLIILKDGTNLTSWDDVEDKGDVLYVSEDVSTQRYLSYKYSRLESLKSIIVQGVSKKVEDLSYMFSNCYSLEYVFGLDSWDTTGLKKIRGMFNDCLSLRDISFLESFDVSNVGVMSGAFQYCISLQDISPLKSWDVGNVKDMHALFCLCLELNSLNGLESWDVGNLRTAESMFHGCGRLEDISYLVGWKPDNIDNLFEMFRDCQSLENADALNEWDIKDDAIVQSMFRNAGAAQKPEWYSDSTSEIEDYIKSIVDEEKLIDMAYNHPDFIARKFATEHIADEDVLKDIIQKTDDTGVFEAAVKNENLRDFEFLVGRLENDSLEVAIMILLRIDDEQCLTRIAKGDFNVRFRVWAISKITDESVLEDISGNDENDAICNFAMRRLDIIRDEKMSEE